MMYYRSAWRPRGLTAEQAANLATCAEAAKIAIEREKERKRMEEQREIERLARIWEAESLRIKAASMPPSDQ